MSNYFVNGGTPLTSIFKANYSGATQPNTGMKDGSGNDLSVLFQPSEDTSSEITYNTNYSAPTLGDLRYWFMNINYVPPFQVSATNFNTSLSTIKQGTTTSQTGMYVFTQCNIDGSCRFKIIKNNNNILFNVLTIAGGGIGGGGRDDIGGGGGGGGGGGLVQYNSIELNYGSDDYYIYVGDGGGRWYDNGILQTDGGGTGIYYQNTTSYTIAASNAGIGGGNASGGSMGGGGAGGTGTTHFKKGGQGGNGSDYLANNGANGSYSLQSTTYNVGGSGNTVYCSGGGGGGCAGYPPTTPTSHGGGDIGGGTGGAIIGSGQQESGYDAATKIDSWTDGIYVGAGGGGGAGGGDGNKKGGKGAQGIVIIWW